MTLRTTGVENAPQPGPAETDKVPKEEEEKEEEDDFYKPRPQTCHYHNGSTWIEPSTPPKPLPTTPPFNPSTLRLISWNIDVLIPFAEQRMSAALSYLSTLITASSSSSPPSTPIIIFFQEMCPSDLRQIQDSAWVQERFLLTDISAANWSDSRYGTTMLVDRRLRVKDVWRRNWYSEYGRDGLFVDIGLARGDGGGGDSGGEKVLRVCNTHLESLVSEPPVRHLQMGVAGRYLREGEVAAALLAGDFNAIQPFDRTLHGENGLEDAYLRMGGVEDSDEGYTWGYQVPGEMRQRFGCSRMDKILFRGDVRVERFERVGIDVKVAEGDREEMERRAAALGYGSLWGYGGF